MQVLPDAVNLRQGPGTNYFIAGGAFKDDSVLVTGQAYECEWLEVQAEDGTTGWVQVDQVSFAQDCAAVPPADIPPTPFIPTPTPTNPGGTKFAVINNTGQSVTLTFRGENNYTFTVPPGRSQVQVIPGQYNIGISCGGAVSYISGYVGPNWYLTIDSCP